MSAFRNLIFLALMLLALPACQGEWPAPLGRTEELPAFTSQLIDDEFAIQVWVPPDFSQARAFPVAFLLDGDWYFYPLARKLGRAVQDGALSSCLLVSVGYAGDADRGRFRDYTYPAATDDDWDYETGGGAVFQTMLATELLPRIAAEYPVDPERVFLLGHSLGGLQVVNSLLRYPDGPFSGFIAASPAIWWEGGTPFQWEIDLAAQVSNRPGRLYLTHGDEEDASIALTVPELHERLLDRAYPDLRLHYRAYRGASHGQTPLVSFFDGLTLFLD